MNERQGGADRRAARGLSRPADTFRRLVPRQPADEPVAGAASIPMPCTSARRGCSRRFEGLRCESPIFGIRPEDIRIDGGTARARRRSARGRTARRRDPAARASRRRGGPTSWCAWPDAASRRQRSRPIWRAARSYDLGLCCTFRPAHHPETDPWPRRPALTVRRNFPRPDSAPASAGRGADGWVVDARAARCARLPHPPPDHAKSSAASRSRCGAGRATTSRLTRRSSSRDPAT